MKLFNFFKRSKTSKQEQNSLQEDVLADVTDLYYKMALESNGNIKKDKKIVVSDDFVVIKEINYIGFFPVYSDNKEYMVCCTDSHIKSIDGKETTINGNIIVCKGDNVLFQKEIPRPNDAKVSDNGIIIVNDWVNYKDLCGEFLIFDDKSNLLFSKKVNANLYNNGLSNSGKYACFQTANNDNEDGSKLFIVDINNLEIISCFNPITGWADSYEFDENNKIIKLYYKNDESSYRYKIDGTFLDSDKLEQLQLNKALDNDYGYDLKNIAFNKITLLQGKKNLTLDDYSDVIELIIKALDKNMSDYNKAVCYRKLGEIYEEFNHPKEALANFNSAISYYPKIGVKRKITSLTATLNESSKE